MTHWIELADFQPDKSTFGFVYQITNTVTGEHYIGCKQFWAKRAGKVVESNWRKYKSSNDTVKSWKVEDCVYTVLEVVSTKYELSHQEVWWLMQMQALRRTDYLNYMLGSNTIGRCPKGFQIAG